MYPAIGAAAIEVGTPQIRNQATVGGNLNQRPRCWYFRNEEFVCFKKGGNTCFSICGREPVSRDPRRWTELHRASLEPGGSDAGLWRTFRLAGPKGERLVPASDYFTLPSQEPADGERACAGRDCLTHVILPAPGNMKSGHYEVRYKASHDWPIAFATALLSFNGATVQSARVVMGAVAPSRGGRPKPSKRWRERRSRKRPRPLRPRPP